MSWFNKQTYLSETIPVSFGRLRVKPLTNGLVNKILADSCIGGTVLNKLYMLKEFEYALVDLRKKDIDSLSLKDGDIVREFIKNLLVKNNIIQIDKPIEKPEVNLFKTNDVDWFNKTANTQYQKIRGSINGRHSHSTNKC